MKVILVDEGDFDKTVMIGSRLKSDLGLDDVTVVQPNSIIVIRDMVNQASFEDELLIEVMEIQ